MLDLVSLSYVQSRQVVLVPSPVIVIHRKPCSFLPDVCVCISNHLYDRCVKSTKDVNTG
jgi:hypothetical protein